MPVFDSAHRQELADRLDYEYWLLDLFRRKYFKQSEKANATTKFTLGNTVATGELLAHVTMTATLDMSEPAVTRVLSEFRVLAFAATFKLHDMIVEWILSANQFNGWKFSEKVRVYDAFMKSGGFLEPTEFASASQLSRGFWELYRKLVPVRNAIVHGERLGIASNGTIEITDGNGILLTSLDEAAQSSYMRLLWLLAATLSNQMLLNANHEAVIENALATLTPIHGVSGFGFRPLRFEALVVVVPIGFERSLDPYQCEIDVETFRDRLMTMAPVGTNGLLLFSLTVVGQTGDRILTWNIPPERVPSGTMVLREDDAAWSDLLEITTP